MDSITNPLGKEKISRLLFRYSFPSIIAMLVSTLYNIVDQIFIGQGVGMLGNGATTVAFPLTIICLVIALLLGVGSASCYSLMLGRQQKKQAAQVVGTSLVLMLVSGVLYMILGWLALDGMLQVFGATPENFPYAQEYSRIVMVGMPLMILGNGFSQLARADGSPSFSMLTMVVGAVVNCILDPIFIFGFGWGMAGAAWATVLGQVVTLVMCLFYLPRFRQIHLERTDFIPSWPIAREVCALGASASLNQAALLVVNIVLNNLLKTYGAQSMYGANIPIAACGVALKLNGIYVSIIVGLSQGSQPIIGFNYGAQLYDRVKKTLLMAMAATIVLGGLTAACFQFFPVPLIELFGHGDALYLRFGAMVLRIMMLMIGIQGIQTLSANYFAAIGQPAKGVLLSLSRTLVFFLPLAVLFARLEGVEALLWAQPLADVLSVLLSIWMVSRSFAQMKQLQKQTVTA